MGKMQQRKGRRGEEELEAILQGYGYPVKRGSPLNYGTEPDLIGLPHIHIECKRQERLDLNAALEQARMDSMRFMDGMPCVFHRASRKPWKVTMLMEDWMRVYQQGNPAEGGGSSAKEPGTSEDLGIVPDA